MSCAVAGELSLRAIGTLERAMTAHDAATHEHSMRVRQYAVALAEDVCSGDPEMIQAIEAAALLHDIGKLVIPTRILHKPGPLTADEYEQIKQHPIIGAEILSAIDFPGPVAQIVRHHHENWDGSGYPDGRRGGQIPIGARVLAIVDCYDALTSERPYRPQLSHDAAARMIAERRGTMYDAAIVDVFLDIIGHGRSAAGHRRVQPAAQESLLWLQEAAAAL